MRQTARRGPEREVAPAPFVAALGCPRCSKINISRALAMSEVPPGALSRMVKLVSGRMPNQSDPGEVLASYTLASDSGTRVGSVIQVLTPTAAQLQLVQRARPSPAPSSSKSRGIPSAWWAWW